MKRNRDAIAQMAIYDLLCRMNDNLDTSFRCIVDALYDSTTEQHRTAKEKCLSVYHNECSSCIQAFLNEPYKGGNQNER